MSDFLLPFIGRSDELTSLKTFYDRGWHRGAGFLLLYSRKGVGKTRLLEQFLQEEAVTDHFYWQTPLGVPSGVESAASAQHDLCFQPPLPKRSVLVSQHSAFQPCLIHPLSIISSMGNLLVTVMTNDNRFAMSGYHVLYPLGFVAFSLPSFA